MAFFLTKQKVKKCVSKTKMLCIKDGSKHLLKWHCLEIEPHLIHSQSRIQAVPSKKSNPMEKNY